MKINEDKEVKAPDLARYGFYLRPLTLIYRREHGFNEARALLLLDSSGIIEKSMVAACRLTAITNYSQATLYSINPIDAKDPSTSSLLQTLNLGRIAQQKTISIQEIEHKFALACSKTDIDLSILTNKTFIGKNASNNKVYEMVSGRYFIDDNGIARRDTEMKNLLYALDEDRNVDDFALRESLESLLDNTDEDYVTLNSMTAFMLVVLQKPPKIHTVTNGNYKPISFIQKNSVTLEHFSAFYYALSKIEARQMQTIENSDDLLLFFQSVYRCKLSRARAYQHDLPAPVIAYLGQILFHDEREKVYCPIAGNIAMLAYFLGKKRSNNSIELNIAEPQLDTKQSLEDYIEDVKSEYADSEFNINTFNLKDELSPPKHDICMTFTTSATTHIGLKIQLSKVQTHSSYYFRVTSCKKP